MARSSYNPDLFGIMFRAALTVPKPKRENGMFNLASWVKMATIKKWSPVIDTAIEGMSDDQLMEAQQVLDDLQLRVEKKFAARFTV